MDINKLYNKEKNHKCTICNNEILIDELQKGNCIVTITKDKRKHFAHKTCLLGGR